MEVEGRSAPDAYGGTDEDIAGLRGFEVGGTITTGVRIYCMRCGDWFADWSSRELYPRLAEMVQEAEQHECAQPAL